MTLGEDGAMLFHEGKIYKSSGFEVEVADTIGSGDSFLACFIANFLNKENIEKTLQKACAVGALVAQNHGATPFISEQAIQNLLNMSKTIESYQLPESF